MYILLFYYFKTSLPKMSLKLSVQMFSFLCHFLSLNEFNFFFPNSPSVSFISKLTEVPARHVFPLIFRSINFLFPHALIPPPPLSPTPPSPFPHRTDLSLLPPFYSLPFIPFSFCLFFPHPRHFQGRGGGRKGGREGRKGRGG